MIKSSTKLLLTSLLASLILSGCNKYEEALKVLPNEVAQANQCISSNKEFETDCYDLISYKNSIALLRLGIKDFGKGNYKEAIAQYTLAKQRGNLYANALLSDAYFSGKGVAVNAKMGLELLEDVDNADPIAAYKLSFYYLNKKDYSKTIKLLEFAAKNNVKKAQLELAKIYRDGKITKADAKRSQELFKAYENKTNSFINKIYGL